MSENRSVLEQDAAAHLTRLQDLVDRKRRNANQTRQADNTADGERLAGQLELEANSIAWAVKRLEPLRRHLPLSTRIGIYPGHDPIGPETEWIGTIEEYWQANGEAMTWGDIRALCDDLADYGSHRIGGGASPCFTIRRVRSDEDLSNLERLTAMGYHFEPQLGGGCQGHCKVIGKITITVGDFYIPGHAVTDKTEKFLAVVETDEIPLEGEGYKEFHGTTLLAVLGAAENQAAKWEGKEQ